MTFTPADNGNVAAVCDHIMAVPPILMFPVGGATYRGSIKDLLDNACPNASASLLLQANVAIGVRTCSYEFGIEHGDESDLSDAVVYTPASDTYSLTDTGAGISGSRQKTFDPRGLKQYYRGFVKATVSAAGFGLCVHNVGLLLLGKTEQS